MNEPESVEQRLKQLALSPPSTFSHSAALMINFIQNNKLDVNPRVDGTAIIPGDLGIDLARIHVGQEATLVRVTFPFLRAAFATVGRGFYSSQEFKWLPVDGVHSTLNDHKPDTFSACEFNVTAKEPNDVPINYDPNHPLPRYAQMKFGVLAAAGLLLEDAWILDFKCENSTLALGQLYDHLRMLLLGSRKSAVRGGLCHRQGIVLLCIDQVGVPTMRMQLDWHQVLLQLF
jgi:hypothetical protein